MERLALLAMLGADALMPYIHPDDRERVWQRFHKHHEILSEGDLAYLISQLVDTYLGTRLPLSYATLAGLDGVLGTSQNEVRRRIINPYEDGKREENGDAFSVFG